MSRRGEIIVECDGASCHAEHIYTVTDLENFCLSDCVCDDGWVERDGLHLCAQCIEEEKPRERERDEDDGQQYGHPGDRLAGRE